MESAKKLYLASSNSGKLQELSAMAAESHSTIELALLPAFSELAPFPEDAPTFSENAVGKALHASTISGEVVCADVSGLVVPARGANFVRLLAAAKQVNALSFFSNRVDGFVLQTPRGSGGFGYDPVFCFPA